MNNYDDIINLPHHTSRNHPSMSKEHRAAQFSPFAALTGYEEAITETGRLTEEKKELDETEIESINMKLTRIEQELGKDTYKIIYFQKDPLKSGGKYIEVKNKIIKINTYEKWILTTNKTKIMMKDIKEISKIN